jgi:O-succinylbenzoic acid--CoA ligase
MLEEVVSEAARDLFRAGVDPTVPASIEARDALATAVLLHAVHRVGAMAVPIGSRLSEEEADRVRAEAGVGHRLQGMVLHLGSGAGVRAPAAPDLARRLDAPAICCFTSGTTDAPRGAVLTHGNFVASAQASAANLGVREDDLWLLCMPLHHVGGLSILMRAALYGTGVLLQDGFDPAAVNEAIDRAGVTLVSFVPPMLERVLRERDGRRFPETLRAALIGGGPCPTDLLEEAATQGLRALPTYGLTETASQVTTLPLDDWPRGLDTAGRPLPGIALEVRDASGRALGPGVEGEIVVRGPVVMAGYLDDRAAGRDSLDRGWLHTGDLGMWGDEGRLVVLDRRTDRIVAGGENVSPAEVEAVLSAHPAVAEACAVGIPSGVWGHDVAVAVRLRPGASLTLEALRDFATPRLSRIKLPRRLLVVAELPRSPSGKLLRRVVRDWFRSQVPEENRA